MNKFLILQSRIKFGSSCLFLYVGQVPERKANDEKEYDYDYFMAELAEHRGVAIDLQTPKINESMENLKSYVLFQEFMDLLPQISEANAISLELNKVIMIILFFFFITTGLITTSCHFIFETCQYFRTLSLVSLFNKSSFLPAIALSDQRFKQS